MVVGGLRDCLGIDLRARRDLLAFVNIGRSSRDQYAPAHERLSLRA